MKERPFDPDPPFYGSWSCGISSLSLLSGVAPERIKLRTPVNDAAMAKWLQKRGFQLTPLTMAALNPDTSCIRCHITPEHVVLVSLMVAKDESSWFVFHGNKVFHGLGIVDDYPLLLLNKPIRSAYMVFHKRWKKV